MFEKTKENLFRTTLKAQSELIGNVFKKRGVGLAISKPVSNSTTKGRA